MESEVRLTVNDQPITVVNFVKTFTEHTVIGMMGGLKDTGEVRVLELSILEGRVTIMVNGSLIAVNEFATRIIISTIEGLLKPMRGVELPVRKVELYIRK